MRHSASLLQPPSSTIGKIISCGEVARLIREKEANRAAATIMNDINKWWGRSHIILFKRISINIFKRVGLCLLEWVYRGKFPFYRVLRFPQNLSAERVFRLCRSQ